MFFYTQKIIQALCSPLVLALIILVVGYFFKKRSPIILVVILLFILSLPAVANLLAASLEESPNTISLENIPNVDAIVVLGGYLSVIKSTDGTRVTWGNPSRFFSAIELYRRHKESMIIFSREKLPWYPPGTDTGLFLQRYAEEMGVPSEKIIISDEVKTTKEEAQTIGALVKELHFEKIILVTSAFHIKRASQLFKNEGINVIPYPIDIITNGNKLGILDFIPNAQSLNLTELFFKEAAARFYYDFIAVDQ